MKWLGTVEFRQLRNYLNKKGHRYKCIKIRIKDDFEEFVRMKLNDTLFLPK